MKCSTFNDPIDKLFDPKTTAHTLYKNKGLAAIELAFTFEQRASVDDNKFMMLFWSAVQQYLYPHGYGNLH